MQNKYSKWIMMLLFSFLCCIFLSACGKPAEVEDNESFKSFLDESFQTLVTRDGFILHTTLIHPEEYEINPASSSKLPDLSEKGMADYLHHLKSMEKELDSYDMKTLSTPQKQVAILLKDNLRAAIEEEEKYPYHRSYLSGSSSFINCQSSFVEYTFRNEDDLSNYQKLLNQLPEYLNQMLAYEVHRQQAGILPSKTALEETLYNLDAFVKTDLSQNIYITSYNSKIAEADFLNEAQKKEYQKKNKALVKNTVIPAYKTILKNMKARLKGSTKMEQIVQYPNGTDYYEHLLHYNVGSHYTPEEAIKALTASLEASEKELTDLREKYPDIETDASCALPKEMDSKKIIESLKKDTLIEFPAIKKVDYTLEDATDSLAGTNSLAYYVIPPYDSEAENRIALCGLSSIELDYFPTLAHEGYPGHMYQTNYCREHIYHPIQLLLGSKGYEEGWGKYAEFYSYDFMEFANIEDEAVAPLQKYLRAQKKFTLTLSCLCDLQVNYNGYDQKQLEKYLEKYNYDASVADNMYYYVKSNAFNYLYYGLGELEFEDLLASAQEKENFSLQQFHKDILDCGSCPFYLLSSFLDEKAGEKSTK